MILSIYNETHWMVKPPSTLISAPFTMPLESCINDLVSRLYSKPTQDSHSRTGKKKKKKKSILTWQRKRIASATSWGSANLPVGMVLRKASLTDWSPQAFCARGVHEIVGDTVFAVIPLPPHSAAILLVSPKRPALEAQYAPCRYNALCAAWDEMLTILPGGGWLLPASTFSHSEK